MKQKVEDISFAPFTSRVYCLLGKSTTSMANLKSMFTEVHLPLYFQTKCRNIFNEEQLPWLFQGLPK